MSDAQIFQIFSVVYLAVGVGMFVNRTFYKKMFDEFIDSAAIMYIGGIMALVIGYLILTFHNAWTKDWSVIITIIGWLALIKGILILIWPKMMIALSKEILKENLLKVMAVWVLFLGLAFSFLGFCPTSPITP